jgi:hypothetical protein
VEQPACIIQRLGEALLGASLQELKAALKAESKQELGDAIKAAVKSAMTSAGGAAEAATPCDRGCGGGLVNQHYVPSLQALYASAEKALPPFRARIEQVARATGGEAKVAPLKGKDRCETSYTQRLDSPY